MKSNLRLILGFSGIAVIVGTVLLVSPALNEAVRAMGAASIVGGLLGALLQLVRDDAARAHQLDMESRREAAQVLLAERKELMDIGIASHMAQKVFDEQSRFAVQYIGAIQENFPVILTEYKAINLANCYQKLVKIRRQFGAWILPEIAEPLANFEDKLWKAQSYMARSENNRDKLPNGSSMNCALEILGQITGTNLSTKHDERDQQIAIDFITAHLQKHTGILGISRLKTRRLHEALERRDAE